MAALDPHELCFVCLGSKHARGGLTDPPECPSCSLLSLKERKQRWAFFSEDFPLEDAISMIASDSEASFDDGASKEEEDVGKCLGSPLKESSQPTDVERTPLPREREGIFSSYGEEEMGSEFSAAPSFAVASLRSDFTGLIERAASRLDIPLPPTPSVPDVDLMVGGPYSRPRRATVLLAPTMPSLARYVEGAWETPLTARAPVKAYIPFTKVDGERLQEMPRLEAALAAYLVPGSSSWPSAKRPTLPTNKDRLTAQLAEKAFALSTQAVAAANNIALLAASLSRLTTGREGLSGEEMEEASRISGAILHLTQASAVCAGRSKATLVVLERHLWLSLTTMKETDKAALLNAPISDGGLFGAAVTDATARFGKLEEEKKQLARHLPLAGGSKTATKDPHRYTVSSRPGSTARRRARRAATPGMPRVGTAPTAAPEKAAVKPVRDTPFISSPWQPRGSQKRRRP